MNQGRSRWWFRLAVVLVVGLGLLVWAWQRSQNHLIVENRSGQPIASLRITVGGESTAFRDVAVGAAVTSPFLVKSEDHFVVEGQLADGTMIRGSGAAGERARLVVGPGGQITLPTGDKRDSPALGR
jgi:hypothetical protein